MCLADPSPGVEPGRTGDQSFDRACGSLGPGAPDVEIVERGRSVAERRHLRRELGCLRAVRVLHSRLVGVELDHAEVVVRTVPIGRERPAKNRPSFALRPHGVSQRLHLVDARGRELHYLHDRCHVAPLLRRWNREHAPAGYAPTRMTSYAAAQTSAYSRLIGLVRAAVLRPCNRSGAPKSVSARGRASKEGEHVPQPDRRHTRRPPRRPAWPASWCGCCPSCARCLARTGGPPSCSTAAAGRRPPSRPSAPPGSTCSPTARDRSTGWPTARSPRTPAPTPTARSTVTGWPRPPSSCRCRCRTGPGPPWATPSPPAGRRRHPDPGADLPHRPARRRGVLAAGRPLAAGELLQIRPSALRPGGPGQLRRHRRRPDPAGAQPRESSREDRG